MFACAKKSCVVDLALLNLANNLHANSVAPLFNFVAQTTI